MYPPHQADGCICRPNLTVLASYSGIVQPQRLFQEQEALGDFLSPSQQNSHSSCQQNFVTPLPLESKTKISSVSRAVLEATITADRRMIKQMELTRKRQLHHAQERYDALQTEWQTVSLQVADLETEAKRVKNELKNELRV